ncbi:hypothetical protein GOBAR_AA20637 [Gossypium barbadense]|uniref:Uncharacterized protein n=1 Tax=Gossypium barbadense TaxID=3634 RepID=A0A2P5X9M6_GOSBA|nr:hypothetical protein GOBAR_AA20637 [Gossypium barbadense]
MNTQALKNMKRIGKIGTQKQPTTDIGKRSTQMTQLSSEKENDMETLEPPTDLTQRRPGISVNVENAEKRKCVGSPGHRKLRSGGRIGSRTRSDEAGRRSGADAWEKRGGEYSLQTTGYSREREYKREGGGMDHAVKKKEFAGNGMCDLKKSPKGKCVDGVLCGERRKNSEENHELK